MSHVLESRRVNGLLGCLCAKFDTDADEGHDNHDADFEYVMSDALNETFQFVSGLGLHSYIDANCVNVIFENQIVLQIYIPLTKKSYHSKIDLLFSCDDGQIPSDDGVLTTSARDFGDMAAIVKSIRTIDRFR